MNTNAVYFADKLIVVDLEFLPDEQLYQRYVKLDPRPARSRWPMKRVVTASVMAMSIADGLMQVEHFKSFSGPDEGRLVSQIFAYLNDRPDHRLVSWGGVHTDIPVLRVAAMEHGLKLPSQIRPHARDRRGWLHLDLCVEMKAGEYVHMSEVATRLAIPVKFGGCAAAIPHLVSERRWREAEWISEADVITTSMLLASHLSILGELNSAEASHHDILSFARRLRGQASYNSYLGNVQQRLRANMKAELHRWMSRVA